MKIPVESMREDDVPESRIAVKLSAELFLRVLVSVKIAVRSSLLAHISRFSWGKNTVVFATCPTPGKLARFQEWLVDTLPTVVTKPFGGSSGGGNAKALGISNGIGGGVGGGGVPTRDDLLAIIGRFEERCVCHTPVCVVLQCVMFQDVSLFSALYSILCHAPRCVILQSVRILRLDTRESHVEGLPFFL